MKVCKTIVNCFKSRMGGAVTIKSCNIFNNFFIPTFLYLHSVSNFHVAWFLFLTNLLLIIYVMLIHLDTGN